ncbi:MAG: 30S ribosomal protein S6 [Bradymonadaceae bacterium]
MKDRQREYETVYLVRPDLNDEEVEQAKDRLSEAIEEAGGHVLKFDDWGIRETAYEVRDESSGDYYENARYQYYRYMVPSHEADVVKDQLRFIESELKALTVKVDEDLIPEERLNEPVDRGESGETLPYSD